MLNTSAGSLGTVTDNGDGTYTATLTSATAVGSANITGTISGNAIGTSASVSFTGNSALALTSSFNPSPAGSNVIFTATVSVVAPTTGTPTGTVVFKDGATPFSTNTLSTGSATAATASLSSGAHTITAEYAGEGFFFGSTNSLNQVIGTPSLANLAITLLNGGSFTIGGAGEPGRTYKLQYSDSLSPANWLDSTNPSVTADSLGHFQFTDTAASGTRFYRAISP